MSSQSYRLRRKTAGRWLRWAIGDAIAEKVPYEHILREVSARARKDRWAKIERLETSARMIGNAVQNKSLHEVISAGRDEYQDVMDAQGIMDDVTA